MQRRCRRAGTAGADPAPEHPALALGVRQYALLNVAVVGVWIVIAVAIVREHRRLTADEVEEQAA